MVTSLLLTNALFCGLAALLLLPLLKHPSTLTYKKGIPLFVIVGAVLLKLIIPYEFSFTRTLASKNILPFLRDIFHIEIFKGINILNFLSWIWGGISLVMILYLILNHWKLKKLLNMVPAAKNTELNKILFNLCIQKGIKRRPQVIQLDIIPSPFIIGFLYPIIVLPTQLSTDEIKFILMHELEHLLHNHIFIKAIMEVTTALHWWNPIIWLFRKEIHRALELQADMNVIKELSDQESFTYLEILVSMTKRISNKSNTALSLSFALKNSMVVYRVSTILKPTYSQKKKTRSILHICLPILSTVLLLFTVMYTFEARYPFPNATEDLFSIDSETDYFILREDKFYDLYIDGEYLITFNNKPKDFSSLKVYK